MDEVEFYLNDLKSKFDKINPKEYALAYSGGKDSHFLLWFIKEYLHDTDIKIIGVNTTLEHPQILSRMKQHCDVVLTPLRKPKDVIEEFGSPCFSKNKDEIISRYQKGLRSVPTMNFILGVNPIFRLNKRERELVLNDKLHKVSPKCCDYLKKKPMKQYTKANKLKTIIGVRSDESITRKAKYTSCFTKDGTFTPIHDLTDNLMNKIYEEYNIEIPHIYDLLTRTGCMGCPYGKNIETELSTLNNNQCKYVIDLFKQSYDVKNVNYVDILKS